MPRTSHRCSRAANVRPPYATLHVHPKFNYKMWHVEGWVGLARWLHERGIASVLTGGSEPGEIEFATAVAAQLPAGNDQSRGADEFRADGVRHRRGAPLRRAGYRDDAHGSGARRPYGRVVRSLQSREMGTVAVSVRRGVVPLASGGHADDGQCRAGAGRGRVRSLHARGLRPACRELFRLPSAIAALDGHRGGRAGVGADHDITKTRINGITAPVRARPPEAHCALALSPVCPSRDVRPARTGTRWRPPATATIRCG